MQLRRRFGPVQALDDVSFTVPEGALVGFVGANGAGKTTTMRIILGILAPHAGEVRWRDRRIDRDARRSIGYMPEERGLYPKMRVSDHLQYLGRLFGMSTADARQSAGELIERLGVSERADDRIEELSLGNQQRVQLAAALVHNPQLLVLDEPFSGLDPVGVDALAGVLSERVRAGVPTVFSSHQLELVEQLCDRVVIIDSGRIVANGTVEQLAAGAGRRICVDVDGADSRWIDDVRGVTATRQVADGVELSLTADADDQAVLAAAQHAGTVRRFAPVRPSLAEMYRALVGRGIAEDRRGDPEGSEQEVAAP